MSDQEHTQDDSTDDSTHHDHDAAHNSDRTPPAGVVPVLDPRPERRLLRAGGSSGYLDVVVRVAQSPNHAQAERSPVHVSLVIDRSGSMSGDKVRTAKRAALAVLDGLSEQDTAAVVVFDDHIDVVQAEEPVTALVKAHVAAELASIDARGSTALHEGWLVGCRAIAADSNEPSVAARTGVRRCFLLTDGQANIGLTAPEALAQAAAQVREMAHVSTSTFGIGADYDEELLGPMAEAGGGQFHHLRTTQEIATTFVGELEQMLGTLARDARLEIKATRGIAVELVSAYPWRAGAPTPADSGRWVATLGDLVGGEDRHVVVSLNFPPVDAATRAHTVQVRLTWQDEAGSHTTAWQQCAFRYAESDAAYDAEARDETVLHYAAKHLSDRAQREAIRARKGGDLERVRTTSRNAFLSLSSLALSADDDVLIDELKSLAAMEDELSALAPDSASLKERYYQSQLRSRSKPDMREWDKRRQRRDADPQPPNDHPAPNDPADGTLPPAGS